MSGARQEGSGYWQRGEASGREGRGTEEAPRPGRPSTASRPGPRVPSPSAPRPPATAAGPPRPPGSVAGPAPSLAAAGSAPSAVQGGGGWASPTSPPPSRTAAARAPATSPVLGPASRPPGTPRRRALRDGHGQRRRGKSQVTSEVSLSSGASPRTPIGEGGATPSCLCRGAAVSYPLCPPSSTLVQVGISGGQQVLAMPELPSC